MGWILRLSEGSLCAVACLGQGESECPKADECPTLPMWRKLETLLNGFFDSITLADLMPRSEETL